MDESGALQPPPAKKRRFFKDPAEEPAHPTRPDANASGSSPHEEPLTADEDGAGTVVLAESGPVADGPPASQPTHESSSVMFDQKLFESFIGDKASPRVLAAIRDHCRDNLERAVNMYFDGTYKQLMKPLSAPGAGSSRAESSRRPPPPPPAPAVEGRIRPPGARYIGAFGVEGWATRSGVGILKHGDAVNIERQKIQPPPPPRVKGKPGVPSAPVRPNTAASRRVDVIVRFTNQSGMEIGRLEKDTANWVSTLMDQNMCTFAGTCVYAPERIRTNDTVFLQLRCSLLASAFTSRRFSLPDDDGPANAVDQSETTDEKELRLRQVALVRLLQEINLQPTMATAAAKDGRKGLLRAAEIDEQKQREAKKDAANGKEPTSPPDSSDAEEGQELEQDQLDALYRKAQCFDDDTPEAEPADTFAMTLRPYQKQSLYWMMAKEKDETSKRERSMHPLWEEYAWPVKDVDGEDLPPVEGQSMFYVNPYSGDLSLEFPVQAQHCLGGVLADEMGLGKTIQMLSLVHSHKSEAARKSRVPATVKQLPRLGGGVVSAPCTTLIVTPMSLLAQWQSEAQRASKHGTLKVELYYGNDKTSNLQARCGSTSAAPDVVMTSYGIVLSEFSSIAARGGDRSRHNGLFSLAFFRVILDEAHHIKNRASKTARACYEISAAHRWVLTGTPIVNKLEDLFSLVRFLGVAPWNNFSFWKTFITVPFASGDVVRALDVVQTVLEPLVMRRTKDMKTRDGQPLVPLPAKRIDIVDVELSPAERDVYDHIFRRAKRTFAQNVEAGTVMKAFTTIFAQILRLRQCCCHPVLVRNRDVVADEEAAGAAADAAAGLADDMDLEALLARFTAATADEGDDEGRAFGAHALEAIRSEAARECPLCLEEPMRDPLVTGCWHSACKACLLDFLARETDRGVVPACFSCRAPLSRRDVFEVVVQEGEGDGAGAGAGAGADADTTAARRPRRIRLQRLDANHSSAKVSALLHHLSALRRAGPRSKAVVFSQFTSLLTLLEPALDRAGMAFVRLDGTLPQRARAGVLAAFAARPGFLVLLISLRAGGVGLNLSSARAVFLMDPWWSFAVEAQAIDRVHRLGQEAEVVVKRFIVKDSVEERMLRIQERKKFLATSLGMMSDEAKKLQRIEDIKELLS